MSLVFEDMTNDFCLTPVITKFKSFYFVAKHSYYTIYLVNEEQSQNECCSDNDKRANDAKINIWVHGGREGYNHSSHAKQYHYKHTRYTMLRVVQRWDVQPPCLPSEESTSKEK